MLPLSSSSLFDTAATATAAGPTCTAFPPATTAPTLFAASSRLGDGVYAALWRSCDKQGGRVVREWRV